MDKIRKEDLLFEIDNVLNQKDYFLVLHHSSLNTLDCIISYDVNYESKIAKMLLSETTTTHVGIIGKIEVYVSLYFSSDYCTIVKKATESAVTYGTSTSPWEVI